MRVVRRFVATRLDDREAAAAADSVEQGEFRVTVALAHDRDEFAPEDCRLIEFFGLTVKIGGA